MAVIFVLYPDIDADDDGFQGAGESQGDLDRDGFMGGAVGIGLGIVGISPEGEAVFQVVAGTETADGGAAPDGGREDAAGGLAGKDRGEGCDELGRGVVGLGDLVRILGQQSHCGILQVLGDAVHIEVAPFSRRRWV